MVAFDCRDVVPAIVEGAPSGPNFEDGYRVARICGAILESGACRAWVEVGTAARMDR
jgi:hypothetical protein